MGPVLPPDCRRFFITGCQRSGTTLLRLILEGHQDIRCFDETRSYGVLAGQQADPFGRSVAKLAHGGG